MVNNEMSEMDIMNFAYNFINLLKKKDNEILELKMEVKRLQEEVRMEVPVELTKDEVINASCPVYVVSKTYSKGFYALPVLGAVKNAVGGLYHFDHYGKTWIAYSSCPDFDVNK